VGLLGDANTSKGGGWKGSAAGATKITQQNNASGRVINHRLGKRGPQRKRWTTWGGGTAQVHNHQTGFEKAQWEAKKSQRGKKGKKFGRGEPKIRVKKSSTKKGLE